MSRDVRRRISEHMNGKGAEWTKLHKPIRVEEVLHNQEEIMERFMTLEYMSLYGIEKVRGAAYTARVLLEFKERILVSMIKRHWAEKGEMERRDLFKKGRMGIKIQIEGGSDPKELEEGREYVSTDVNPVEYTLVLNGVRYSLRPMDEEDKRGETEKGEEERLFSLDTISLQLVLSRRSK